MTQFINDIPDKLNISEIPCSLQRTYYVAFSRFGGQIELLGLLVSISVWKPFPSFEEKILSLSNISSQLERYVKRSFTFKRQSKLIVGHGKDRFVLLQSGDFLAVSKKLNDFPYQVSGILLQKEHDVYTVPYPSSTFHIKVYSLTSKECSGIALKKCVALPYRHELFVILYEQHKLRMFWTLALFSWCICL